ncbi:acid phosphatase [Undibacterium oligocarboniphilum]|uniref:Acid phosphatase n=1 Tax=Undibacterium oligocarboniphilum TaxID=666702 RepID=A0A850QG59_9BURK|nr:acid phosphatase [Undibacterium oligocarboniphilum]MBC3870647.1 acid phosphatase [Undibacterium oligocarboniphilum]NVO78551.1 acid phosphatase [Undibacterium oligocarboniphilum]
MKHLLIPALLAAAWAPAAQAAGSLDKIQNIVVIYGENRSFDNLYGLFPGANGIGRAFVEQSYLQTDMNGKVLPQLPPTWDKPGVANKDIPQGLPNMPFSIDAPPINQPLNKATNDLVHRFYQNQMQINGGKNDRFAAISDAGGLSMGHYDGSSLPMWKIAQEYTLADNFFMGAFGGSFLNHMWLACACTPVFKDAPDSMRAKLDANGNLLTKAGSPTDPLTGAPQYQDGAVTPDGYGVNTLQPTYQPSGIPPANNPALADSSKHPLPPQTQTSIGDTLSEKKVSWKWYAGGWNQALNDRSQIYGGKINFQPHHQPFNYFSRFAPGTPDRAEHLKDGQEFFDDIAKGHLPQVAFYKPQGELNEHPGYTDVMSGDAHIAALVRKLQASPQWKHMLIVVTYDENGGFWDHVAPPKGERWGPGNRIPAIIISPYAKKGYVDNTPYDTTSILKLITRRFKLAPLPGVRASAGDLTAALQD